jgi:hypothetical protein
MRNPLRKRVPRQTRLSSLRERKTISRGGTRLCFLEQPIAKCPQFWQRGIVCPVDDVVGECGIHSNFRKQALQATGCEVFMGENASCKSDTTPLDRSLQHRGRIVDPHSPLRERRTDRE